MMYNIKLYIEAINDRINEIARAVDYNITLLNEEQVEEMKELTAMEEYLLSVC